MADSISRFAWIDDRIVPFEQAKVPIDDRGLLFAESIYEVDSPDRRKGAHAPRAHSAHAGRGRAHRARWRRARRIDVGTARSRVGQRGAHAGGAPLRAAHRRQCTPPAPPALARPAPLFCLSRSVSLSARRRGRPRHRFAFLHRPALGALRSENDHAFARSSGQAGRGGRRSGRSVVRGPRWLRARRGEQQRLSPGRRSIDDARARASIFCPGSRARWWPILPPTWAAPSITSPFPCRVFFKRRKSSSPRRRCSSCPWCASTAGLSAMGRSGRLHASWRSVYGRASSFKDEGARQHPPPP